MHYAVDNSLPVQFYRGVHFKYFFLMRTFLLIIISLVLILKYNIPITVSVDVFIGNIGGKN